MDYTWWKTRPPVLTPIDGGWIRPVWEGDYTNPEVTDFLWHTRMINGEAYPSRPKEVTQFSVLKWMRGMLDKKDRILFLVIAPNGRMIGHLGYNNGNEIDNVMRGVPNFSDADTNFPGLMSYAMRGLLAWGEDVCFLEDIYLRVFADNAHAIAFYERLGFVRDREIPLKRVDHDWGFAYEEGEPEEKRFLRMAYRPESTGHILTAGPSISQREVEYGADAVHQLNKNYTGYVRKLEEKACDYLGVKYALATSSCTGAMHLALEALGIKRGDAVVVPEITWVATASVVEYTGATPLFCEIHKDSWTLEYPPSSTVRASIPVHLYGHPSAGTSHVWAIEDAAAALGAEIDGRKAGTNGLAGCYSFQGAKLLTASEGGLLVTNTSWIYEYAKMLNDHGRDPVRTFWINKLGFKYKMSNMQAAVALAQLERIDDLLEKKKKIHDWYVDMLSNVPCVFQRSPKNHKPSHWMISCTVPDRDLLMTELAKDGIDTRPVFPCISKYPIWGMRREPDHHPVAEYVSTHGINLPSGVTLKKRDVERVCKAVRKCLA